MKKRWDDEDERERKEGSGSGWDAQPPAKYHHPSTILSEFGAYSKTFDTFALILTDIYLNTQPS